eukprot:Skav205235  [mRNA]  locus=scaffold1794:171007:172436:+ [translate_table: standard]
MVSVKGVRNLPELLRAKRNRLPSPAPDRATSPGTPQEAQTELEPQPVPEAENAGPTLLTAKVAQDEKHIMSHVVDDSCSVELRLYRQRAKAHPSEALPKRSCAPVLDMARVLRDPMDHCLH